MQHDDELGVLGGAVHRVGAAIVHVAGQGAVELLQAAAQQAFALPLGQRGQFLHFQDHHPVAAIGGGVHAGGRMRLQQRLAFALQGAAAFIEQAHRGARQRAETVALGLGELARRGVQHADRAQRDTFFGDQRHAGVEARAGVAAHHLQVGEARVVGEVGHFQHVLGLTDGVVAYRLAALGLRQFQADPCLEPLAVAVQQRQQRDRRVAQRGGDLHDVLVGGLGQAVDDAVAVEDTLALGFIGHGRRRVWCGSRGAAPYRRAWRGRVDKRASVTRCTRDPACAAWRRG